MQTKRVRRPRHRVPDGFESLSGLELIHWSVYGPMIDENPRAASGMTVYPSWTAWADFYGRVRTEFLASLREVPASERLYKAIQAGRDPEAVVVELKRERELNDPRLILLSEPGSSRQRSSQS